MPGLSIPPVSGVTLFQIFVIGISIPAHIDLVDSINHNLRSANLPTTVFVSLQGAPSFSNTRIVYPYGGTFTFDFKGLFPGIVVSLGDHFVFSSFMSVVVLRGKLL